MSPHLVGKREGKHLSLGEDGVKDCRKHGGGETAESAWVVGKREQKPGNEASTPTLKEENSSALSLSDCIWMQYKNFSYLVVLECAKSKVVEVWGWDCYSLCCCSNYSFFFWTLSAIKIMLIFMLCLSIYTWYLSFPVHVTLLPIPLTFVSCCLDFFASSCVYFSLPLCQFKSVILSFQVLQATSGAISSFSTSWPFLKASLTSSASNFRG